eukprot:TRINITY_DN2795_c0_g1_i9.p1 TRINITY_DN2795_c0_g1~~TRINITY_DN2795_c0_g1_i9.p1  ORF type:complete len:338 (+),score=55.83 TRINITY_DN2795_c0_g1_i9:134-1015(+)
MRFYARRTERRTVDTKEQQESQDHQTSLQQQETGGWFTQQTSTPQAEERTEDVLYVPIKFFLFCSKKCYQSVVVLLILYFPSRTPDTLSFLNKVYGTMMGGCGMAAIGATVGAIAPIMALPGFVGSLIAVIAFCFTDPSRSALRTTLFMSITGLLGLTIGPLVAASTLGAVMAAGLGTCGIFAGFTLAALKAKRRSMLLLGGPLLGALGALVLCSLGSMLLPMFGVTSPAILGALHSFNLYGGLAIFSLFISYDTQQMIENHKEGMRDHLSPALNMFLNVFNIFVRLLSIFRE